MGMKRRAKQCMTVRLLCRSAINAFLFDLVHCSFKSTVFDCLLQVRRQHVRILEFWNLFCTQNTLPGTCHCTLFLVSTWLRTSVAQDKVVSTLFIVIQHAHSHPVSLTSLLNVKFTPFPSLLSSPGASSSRLQRHFRAAQEVGVNPQTDPLAGGSLAAWSIPLQTQVLGSIFPLSATGCPVPLPHWWWSSCWTCQAFLRLTVGGDAVMSESSDTESFQFWCFTTFSRQSAKADGIGIRLPKYQSSVLSIFQNDTTCCVLTHCQSRSVRYMSWFCHVIRFILLRTLRIHRCEGYRLSYFFRMFSSCDQTWLGNRMQIMRRTNALNVFNPILWNFHVIMQWSVNFVRSRVALNR